jgi:hypothetical protein
MKYVIPSTAKKKVSVFLRWVVFLRLIETIAMLMMASATYNTVLVQNDVFIRIHSPYVTG